LRDGIAATPKMKITSLHIQVQDSHGSSWTEWLKIELKHYEYKNHAARTSLFR
jgi:hypothetical protein